jgi:hypothetical protein
MINNFHSLSLINFIPFLISTGIAHADLTSNTSVHSKITSKHSATDMWRMGLIALMMWRKMRGSCLLKWSIALAMAAVADCLLQVDRHINTVEIYIEEEICLFENEARGSFHIMHAINDQGLSYSY